MDWEKIQKAYDSSFTHDIEIEGWNNTKHNISIKRCQEWDSGNFFLSSDMNIKDIYLDYSVISKEWCGIYGIPTLKDFVIQVSREQVKSRVVSVNKHMPWRVYAGRDGCQWMYRTVLEILDVIMRYVCSLYPREYNNEFVLGDAGCRRGESCPGHGGAHDGRSVIDLNYCTHKDFNMTHYRRKGMPDKYNGSNVNFWKNPFTHQGLETEVFDTEKNYALYKLLKQVFPKSVLMTSTGLNNHFKKVYGGSVLQGDDVDHYNHYRHAHLYLEYNKIDWDAKIKY